MDLKESLSHYKEKILKDLEKLEAKVSELRGFFNEGPPEIYFSEKFSDMVLGILKDKNLPQTFKEIIERILSKAQPRNIQILELAVQIYEASFMPSVVENIELALKVACIFMTEGRVTMEGINKVQTNDKNQLQIFYEGPIRAFGGTAAALTIVIANELRKKANLPKYEHTPKECRRWVEEIHLYDQEHARLQYFPNEEQILAAVSSFPIMPNSTGLRHVPLSNSFSIPEVGHNYVRGGACLFIAEGFIAKVNKVKNFVEENGIRDWDECLELLLRFQMERIKKETEEPHEENEFEIFDDSGFLVGRPVFGFDGQKGTFRVIYGRTRFTGMLSVAINPVNAFLFNKFLGIGTQLKMNFPSKGATCTFSEDLEGPFLELHDGSCMRVNTLHEYEKVKDKFTHILDCGEILIAPGDIVHQNKKISLIPRSKREYLARLAEKKITVDYEGMDYAESNNLFEQGFGENPRFLPFMNSLSVEDFFLIRETLVYSGFISEGNLLISFPSDAFLRAFKEILMDFSIKKTETNKFFCLSSEITSSILKYFHLVTDSTGFVLPKGLPPIGKEVDSEFISSYLGRKVSLKSDFFLGVRMGRPEKGKKRENSGGKMAPNGIIYCNTLDQRRNLRKASKPEKITGEKFICTNCTYENSRPTPFRICDVCNAKTVHSGKKTRINYSINWNELIERKAKYYGIDLGSLPVIKGMESRFPRADNMEPIEKALFKAKCKLLTFRDGTSRFDATNLITTQFIPREIGMELKDVFELGYHLDSVGNPIISVDQLIDLFPQDVILPEKIREFFLQTDEYLSLVASLANIDFEGPPFIGRYVLLIAPHISIGSVARVIGYSPSTCCIQHPLMLASKRRNADGDEDSICDLSQALLDYSPSLIKSSLGNQMDTPVNVIKILNPQEVDSEGKMITSFSKFLEEELELVTAKNASILSDFKCFEEIRPLLFTHEAIPLDNPYVNLTSSYKEDTSIDEKLDSQLEILLRLNRINVGRVVRGIITSHLIPDIVGNLRKYFNQDLRCPKCKKKYRTFTISGFCVCNSELIPTIYPLGIKKYVRIIERLLGEFKIDDYIDEVFFKIKEELLESF